MNMNRNDADRYVVVTTSNMGSCWCGDCYCRVYADGSIQYTGNEDWQKSVRRPPVFVDGGADEVRSEIHRRPNRFTGLRVDWGDGLRPYWSNLRERDYLSALAEARRDW